MAMVALWEIISIQDRCPRRVNRSNAKSAAVVPSVSSLLVAAAAVVPVAAWVDNGRDKDMAAAMCVSAVAM